MNSKLLVIFSTLIVATGCGVKADPVKFPETAIDSYVQGYTGNEPTPEEQERIKNNKDALDAAKKNEETKAPLIPTP